MSVLSEASKILGTPLGSLVYHLLLLFAVEAILGMAWEEWRRTNHREGQRLLIAAAGLALVRLGYIAASASGTLGWADPVAVLPPLERFADTASLALIGWALLPASSSEQQRRGPGLFLAANLVLAVVAGAGAIVLWNRSLAADPTLDYNLSYEAMAWSGWQIVLAVLAGIAVLRTRVEGWALFLLAVGIALVGRVLQLISPPAVLHLPTWERLANLVAYPLLVVAVYQSIIVGLRAHSRQLQDISQASMDQIKSLLFLFEAGRAMSSSLDLPTVLDNAVQGVARALDADQCAVAFPQEGDPGQMRLAAIFNPARQGRGEGVAFPLDYQLAVRQAMRRKRYVIVDDTDNVQLKVLFALLGSAETGPLLIQPLLAGDEAIGAIIVGNSRSRRSFNPNEAKLCQSMAEQVVGALQNARRFKALQEAADEVRTQLADERRVSQQLKAQVQELTDRLAALQTSMEDLRRREESAREARNALEIKLVSSRAESEAMANRLAMLESDLAQTHANAEAQLNWQRDELIRQEAAWQEALHNHERLAGVLHGMTAGVLIADANGNIQEANVAAEILLDYGAGELKDASLASISTEPRWEQAVTTAAAGEAVRLTLKHGNNILLCDVAPLSTASGDRPDGIVVVMQDISAETEQNAGQFGRLAARIEDLRGSLATVTNYANLMLSDSTGMVGNKFVLRLRTGVERMAQTVDELARLVMSGEAGSTNHEAVDVGYLIQTAVAESQQRLRDRPLAVDLELSRDLPSVDGDADDLRQAVVNLLVHACLASPPGGRVQVQASRSDSFDLNGDGYVVVSVKDCGGGLSRDALEHVFDRARPGLQGTSYNSVAAPDLALVKTLVEAHRGRVWVVTENGVGTTFLMALPIQGKG